MVIVYGCGGHARSIADILLYNDVTEFIFVDKNAKLNEKIYGRLVLKELPEDVNAKRGILGIGDNSARRQMAQNLPGQYINIVSRNSYVSERAELDKGIFVGHLAYIGPSVKIGQHTIINTKATIEHEVEIGAFSHVAPNVTIAGRTTIGNMVFIGAGTTIIDKIQIVSNVVIGANSTVIRSIVEAGVYVGNPVRKIKG
jgi:sugar O-acyltransferase (sialic acid O-acetyltransferase NeuD family)